MTEGHPQGDMSGNEGVKVRGKLWRQQLSYLTPFTFTFTLTSAPLRCSGAERADGGG